MAEKPPLTQTPKRSNFRAAISRSRKIKKAANCVQLFLFVGEYDAAFWRDVFVDRVGTDVCASKTS
ncbi:MAG: hypothetical protein AUH11_14325 [Acidobacteria bacterium 13_2_20CM_57_17]|nr:MAG: hypothetical protein AUH11_14325 [Acidobacteria bacterium 13_2_20CM_57_17]